MRLEELDFCVHKLKRKLRPISSATDDRQCSEITGNVNKSVTAGTVGEIRKRVFVEAGNCTVCCRLMFWTDWNREAPKIEKANMDGTDRQSLVTEGLSLPNGLTADYHSSQICWADAGKPSNHHVTCTVQMWGLSVLRLQKLEFTVSQGKQL